jgi:hypothetical protein
MKKLTPLKAIRAKCIDCSGYELKEVRECPFDGKEDKACALHPLRMGKGSRSTLKQIRAFCLWCCLDQKHEVKLCPAVSCPLWKYRLGKRPQKCPLAPEIAATDGILENNLSTVTNRLWQEVGL